LYHAAQVGISSGAKNPTARSYLSPLLTVLEKMKKEIGPNDAVDNDVVAAAYVENFALKIFGVTDSEDRAGNATRGTAKKFLVAANLLELLQVFDKANVSDSVRCRRVHSLRDVNRLTGFHLGRRQDPICEVESGRYCKSIP
jgi:vacuolar protein sorting-associated protein VTA1